MKMSDVMRLILLLLLPFMALITSSTPTNETESLSLALDALILAKTRASAFSTLYKQGPSNKAQAGGPWADCFRLYSNSEDRIRRLMEKGDTYDPIDACAWLSSMLTSHATCIDGLTELNVSVTKRRHDELEAVLRKALAALPASRSSGEFAWILGYYISSPLDVGLGCATWMCWVD